MNRIKKLLFQPSTINHQLSTKYGFSLIELLVVITLIGIIGVITTQVFILGFRSQGKSEITKEVKQNGDYTLSVIESMVRNAVNIQAGCNQSVAQLPITNPDGYTTTFFCSEGDKIASISSGFPDPTPSVSQALTNNKVAVYNCSVAFRIVCPTPPINPKYVFVNFTVSQAGVGLTPTPGSFSSIDYQTTISLRNYQ